MRLFEVKQQLSTIAKWLKATGQHIKDELVEGVSIDSRTVKKGDLFIPFRGEQVNGHRYVEKAIEQGAVASLWMKDEPNPPVDVPLIFIEDSEIALQEMARIYRETLSCKVIGVTGSNGKTSTKDLIASVLAPYFSVQKTEGNFNNELGLPLTILSLDETTEYAVLEMGMSGFGEISFLSKLAKPDYAIITNIGEAHMQDLGSREGIARAKFEIVDGLAVGGKLFYDGDEPLLQSLVKEKRVKNAFSFGYAEQNDLSLMTIQSTDEGSQFKTSGFLTGDFSIPIYGSHQVKNTLSALFIAYEASVTAQDMKEALKHAKLTDMRMEPIVMPNGSLFINDAYNAAPTSVRAALQFMEDTQLRPEKWLVLGDMLELGTEEKIYHEALAEKIEQMKVEGVLLYGQRMKWLYEKMKGKRHNFELMWFEKEVNLIADTLERATNSHSVVLLKGSRGMELERIVADLKRRLEK